MKVLIAYSGTIPSDRDFLFEPKYSEGLDFGPNSGVYVYIVDSSLSFV